MKLLNLELINLVPMFRSFTKREKEKIAAFNHSLFSYQNNETIIRENEPNSCLYLLLQGSVRIEKKNTPEPIATLEAGSIFGEMSFLTKRPRFNSVIANDTVLVMKMDQTFFDQISPVIRDKIKNYLIEVLVQRLDSVNTALAKLSAIAR